MGVKITQDNSPIVMAELDADVRMALEMIGLKAEGYAKALCPVGTPESTGIKGYMGGTLRNSITHKVNTDGKSVSIGTNVEYAPYVELGTVKMKKKPYLLPAVRDHMELYKQIIRDTLK